MDIDFLISKVLEDVDYAALLLDFDTLDDLDK